jgi:hypothetical protein
MCDRIRSPRLAPVEPVFRQLHQKQIRDHDRDEPQPEL